MQAADGISHKFAAKFPEACTAFAVLQTAARWCLGSCGILGPNLCLSRRQGVRGIMC